MSATLIRPLGEFRVFDVLDYQFDEQIAVTEHPVELGAPVSDHAQRLPRVITLNDVITETPIATKAGGVLSQRRGDFLLFLDACEGESLTLVADEYGTFSGYMLAGYPHRLDSIKRSVLVITLKQVRIAEAGSVTIPVSAPASSAVSSAFGSAADVGEQATSTANAAQQAADTSVLFDLVYGG